MLFERVAQPSLSMEIYHLPFCRYIVSEHSILPAFRSRDQHFLNVSLSPLGKEGGAWYDKEHNERIKEAAYGAAGNESRQP